MSWMNACADAIDAKYCKGLEKHLSALGIPAKMADSAMSHMVSQDVVPTKNICAATPSLFPKPSQKATTSFVPEMPQTA